MRKTAGAPDAAERLVEVSRAAISRILHGHDDRLLVIVGPCSIHDHDQAMEYARLLKARRRSMPPTCWMVMRVYLKSRAPRSAGRAIINDPHLDGSFAINEGLEMARRLLLDVLARDCRSAPSFDLLSPSSLAIGHLGRHRRPYHRRARAIVSWPVGCRARSVSRTAPMAA